MSVPGGDMVRTGGPEALGPQHDPEKTGEWETGAAKGSTRPGVKKDDPR